MHWVIFCMVLETYCIRIQSFLESMIWKFQIDVYCKYLLESYTFSAPTSKLKEPSEENAPSPGYQLIPGLGYYKVHTERKQWPEALITCEQEGAHLYVFNSKEEIDAVDELILRSSTGRTNYWIGVHDQYQERHYVTIFSKYFTFCACLYGWTVRNYTLTTL